MPIEHELKFVLKDSDGSLLTKLSGLYDTHHLEQFYLSDGARFRRSQRVALGAIQADPAEHIFCYKQKISGKVLEIETAVSSEDYDLAMVAANSQLRKMRFKVPVKNGVWDIDYFLSDAPGSHDSIVYFVMAEYEHEKGTPVEVLDVLAPHVRLAVPHNNSHQYSSRKLCDREYARRLYSSLR